MTPVSRIRRFPSDEALKFADSVLRDARSPLIQYRLGSDFQANWKEEVGHWMMLARQLGFLDDLLNKVVKRAVRRGPGKGMDPVAIHPNDVPHLKLHQELAPAMIVYYLTGLGWTFEAWEPPKPPGCDLDFRLRAPTGQSVIFQAKAPDRPGEVANHRRYDGENDEDVLTALRNAVTQLPNPAPEPTIVALSPHRNWGVSGDPDFLISEVYGSTHNITETKARYRPGLPDVILPFHERGEFFKTWRHVGAIAVVDLVRPAGEAFYSATVLTNPAAQSLARVEASWFASASVLHVVDGAFRWQGTARGGYVPDGTALMSFD